MKKTSDENTERYVRHLLDLLLCVVVLLDVVVLVAGWLRALCLVSLHFIFARYLVAYGLRTLADRVLSPSRFLLQLVGISLCLQQDRPVLLQWLS